MANGLPDYYRGVDIAYQALARLLVRPTYGTAKTEYSGDTVLGLRENQLVSVSGQGMIYGGAIWLDYSSTQQNSLVYLYIDGVRLEQWTFASLYKYQLRKPGAVPFYLLRYDNSDFIYSCGLSPGYTFESSFAVKYNEKHNTTPTVYYAITYALIT